jgi:Putative beta-barrel porin-2, OmpL-like. bbp2
MTIRSVSSRASVWLAGAVLVAMAAPVTAQQNDPIGQGLAAAMKRAAVSSAASTNASGDEQAPAPENPVLKFFASTELTGFVDAYYTYNFNKPAKECVTVGGVAIFNCLHNFDVAHNAFSLNLAELALEKKPSTDSRAGFRVDLDYGSAAAIVAGFDPGGTSIYQNVQQAYLSYLAPTKKGSLQFDFGKWVTQHGAEVIETKDNWNYSRSLLFALAIPYYHMGVRVNYSPSDKVTFGANISNGWNNVVENNSGKTGGFMFLYKPTSAVSWSANYMVGPETAGTNDPIRNLFDTTLVYTASPKMSLMANYDYGKDGDSSWQGFAGYLKYQANDWFAVIPRYEYYNDGDGFTTTLAQNVQEFTLTLEFKHKDGFLTRVEYRGDFSDEAFFHTDSDSLKKNQNVFTIGWVYSFSSKAP